VIRALPLAAILILLEPVVGPWWSIVALMTWGAVRTGLRAGLNLRGELWERRVRARLRREIGAAEMVRLTPIPCRHERDLSKDP